MRFRPFACPVPASAREWEGQKPRWRRTLWRLLRASPPRATPRVAVDWRRRRPGYRLEKIHFTNGFGDPVPGYVLVPETGGRRLPAILYHHQHAGRYAVGKREVIRPEHPQLGFATGEALVRAGYVVLAIDAWGFGERRRPGPAGERESGRQGETSLFKELLWEGHTLWGSMVRDDLLAARYLRSRPEVDPDRVGALGMSMGATRSWWAAALDERIRAVVSVACLTRYQQLIEQGELRQHGLYYFVPGVLAAGIDMECVIGLIAPRPHLTLSGDADPGSPAAGVRIIHRFERALYRLYGASGHFRGVVYPGVGHQWTPAMWRETLAWLRRHL